MVTEEDIERESRRVHKNTLCVGQTIWVVSPVFKERVAYDEHDKDYKSSDSPRNVIHLYQGEIQEINTDHIIVVRRRYGVTHSRSTEKWFYTDHNIQPHSNAMGVEYGTFNSYAHAYERVRKQVSKPLNVFLHILVAGLDPKMRGRIYYRLGVTQTELLPEELFRHSDEPMGCLVNTLESYSHDPRSLKTLDRSEHYREQAERFAQLGEQNES